MLSSLPTATTKICAMPNIALRSVRKKVITLSAQFILSRISSFLSLAGPLFQVDVSTVSFSHHTDSYGYIKFFRIVVDEGQIIRNRATRQSMSIVYNKLTSCQFLYRNGQSYNRSSCNLSLAPDWVCWREIYLMCSAYFFIQNSHCQQSCRRLKRQKSLCLLYSQVGRSTSTESIDDFPSPTPEECQVGREKSHRFT